jgi:hypothetical protein
MFDDYAGVCGYTQQEMEQAFGAYIGQLAEKLRITNEDTLAKVKHWYNGYSWDGLTFVYNPYSVLLSLNFKTFSPHWYQTGTPTFLLKLLKEKGDFTPVLAEDIVQPPGFENRQSLSALSLVPLFFQTGYLTVKSIDGKGRYHLGIPNNEVKVALTESVLSEFAQKDPTQVGLLADSLAGSFATGNIANAIQTLSILFSAITYNTHIPQERHYHALLQLALNMAGIQQHSEVYTNTGRADTVLFFEDRIYVLEVKYADKKNSLNQTAAQALGQIEEKKYYEPYLGQGKKIILLGIAFTKEDVAYASTFL